MKILVHPHDRAPLEMGLAKISKMSDNVVKMSTFLRIESATAARHSAACERAKTLIKTTAEGPAGFAGEIEIPDDVREALYTASLAWLRDLNDTLVPQQTKMTIGMNETDLRKQQIENLRDRLNGVLGIFDTIRPGDAAAAEPDAKSDGAGHLADPDDSLWDEGPDAHRTGPALVGDTAPAGRKAAAGGKS